MRKQSSRQKKKTVKWDIQQSFQSIVNEFVDNVINFSGLFLSGLTGIKLNLVEDLPDKVMFLKKGLISTYQYWLTTTLLNDF